ncbi:prephenate dehydratase [Methanofollis fontis]|uniref:Prephenate dehydratase n=1 Tax=Methanofollis fontis TaxID=2052832 RepID=A0A483CZ86_9EURY|nr:prephenate dehydratase domain-containing protein [Methanofollis fontis]TAJ45349.1 prephenate dehydratase [Methanofollis fontis]
MSLRTMRLAALGPEGTVSHAIASRLADEVVLLPTIAAVFAHVAAGGGDGVVPIENSEAGGVGAVLDALMRHPLFITAEVYVPVRHHLASFVGREAITELHAHPQAHEQCSRLADALGVPVIHTPSNAASARAVRPDGTAAAITTLAAAERAGVPVLESDVQDAAGNTTRFVVISRQRYAGEDAVKCSVLIDPRTDRVGLLAEMLAVFARRSINLTRIESRPARRGMGRYVFFVDGHASPAWEGALAELDGLAAVQWFGCYPRLEVGEWR